MTSKIAQLQYEITKKLRFSSHKTEAQVFAHKTEALT